MTWEEKLAALKALAPCTVEMRAPGDWYVQHAVEVRDGGLLKSSYGEGRTVEEAVHNHWIALTRLPPDQCLVINAMNVKTRREVRWNGYMWRDNQ